MADTPERIAEKRRRFRLLHASGCFVIPNPWDIGSARMLQHLGFPALASTSAGFAWSRGLADNGVTLEMALAHLAQLAAAIDVPLNADFEGGFAVDPDRVVQHVRMAVDTGLAGLSIEDSTGRADEPLHAFDLAVERIRAARRAIDAMDAGVLLVGRSEGFISGRPDLDETMARLKAYAENGADCLYAPGLTTRDQISAVVAAVAPKPVNVLVGATSAFTVADLAALGVRRISVGGALARAAWGGFLRAARALADGRFDGFADAATFKELNPFFTEDAKQRPD